MTSISDRRTGALIGAAVGDALGVTYEFLAPKQIRAKRFTMVGGGPFGFAAGEGSDDTDLLHAALCAYRGRDRFEPELMVANMLEWLAGDPPDIGNTTYASLHSWRDGVRPPPDEAAQGNGGLMRAAAHALACDSAELACRFAAEDTLLTHPSMVAAECSGFYAATLWWLIDGVDVAAAMARARELTTAFEPYSNAVADRGGRCVHSLRLALWAAGAADTFEQGVDAVIRTGGDTDTNATIAGALLGARFGVTGIPADWVAELADSNRQRLNAAGVRLSLVPLPG